MSATTNYRQKGRKKPHNNKEPDMVRECVQKSDGRPEPRLPHIMYSSEGNGEVTSEQEEKLLSSIR